MIELAHGVGRVYESPLPTYLYGIGAGATVAASFVIRAFAREVPAERGPRRLLSAGAARAVGMSFRVVAAAALALTVMSGALVRGQGLLPAPLLFWVGLIVLTVAVNAIVDRAWDAADPWAALHELYNPGEHRDDEPPWWLGPLLLYGLFWFELVSGIGFDSSAIAAVLIGYTVYIFVFRARFGRWWDEADPLRVLFGFAGRAAPLQLRDDGLFYRGPVQGLDDREPMRLTLFASLFVLLGATTLDNVRETVAWSELLGSAGIDALPAMLVDSLALIVFAVGFFVPFALALLVSRSAFGQRPFLVVARRFAWSLVPIGVVYLLAHNAPLLLTGLPQLIVELSDPFDRGWNLFGTAGLFHGYSASPALVWFLEIALIVYGHVLGVLVAHRTAVRLAGSHRGAVISQIALTVLMSFFTIATLGLLAQPLVA